MGTFWVVTITLHVPYLKETYHLIAEKEFKNMKKSAYLINASRGPVVEQQALIKALKNKMIAGAALDVFETEPLQDDSPLLSMDQVMLAPHNSNSSPLAREAVHWNTIRNLLVGLGLPLDKFDAIKEEKMGVQE